MSFALALVVSGIVTAAPVSPAPVRAASDLCAAPKGADSAWMPVAIGGVSINIPEQFVINSSSSYYRIYSTAKVDIRLYVGHLMPQQPNGLVLTKCHTMIGNRAVTITLWKYPNAVTELAEWPASQGMGIVELAIAAEFQSDLEALRAVIWSARFAGFSAVGAAIASCQKAAKSPPKIADVLDTGVVSMLASGASPPLPIGSAIFEFSFDSTGAMGPLSITAASIPDSAVRRLAMIVGSNVKDQPPGAKRVGVRVEIAAAGLSYSPVPVSCGPP